MINPYFDLHQSLEKSAPHALPEIRKKLVWAYSWAIPTREAIEVIASLSPLVELGAGTGYWAWLLRQVGADVIALDREPAQPPRWTEILQGDETSLEAHAGRALFLCWPPLDEPMAELALAGFERVAYVGEWRGRTGSKAFHDLLERDFVLERKIEIPRWPGFEDALYLLRRRSASTRPA